MLEPTRRGEFASDKGKSPVFSTQDSRLCGFSQGGLATSPDLYMEPGRKRKQEKTEKNWRQGPGMGQFALCDHLDRSVCVSNSLPQTEGSLGRCQSRLAWFRVWGYVGCWVYSLESGLRVLGSSRLLANSLGQYTVCGKLA